MKSIFHSKTFWLATIQAVAGVVTVFATTYPSVGFLLIVKSIVDMCLRMTTTTQVTL